MDANTAFEQWWESPTRLPSLSPESDELAKATWLAAWRARRARDQEIARNHQCTHECAAGDADGLNNCHKQLADAIAQEDAG